MLSLTGIHKRFGSVHALKNVDFGLLPGEIHALLGENGAGKSTLIKVITGVHAADAGTMSLDNVAITPHSPAHAHALGISTVYQEVNLLPNLSVAHNVFLGREPTRFGCIQWRKLVSDTQQLLLRFKLDIDVTKSLSSFPVAIQQLVAIARGVDCSAKVLILDEPTASLDAKEVQLLFATLKELKQQGMGIIFITHFLDQVYALADRITVLRNGERIGTFVTQELPKPVLIAHMLGRELQAMEKPEDNTQAAGSLEPYLQVANLCAGNGLSNVCFAVARGQALGLSGLLGSGRTELCNTLFGIHLRTSGETRIAKRLVAIENPAQAIRLGMALCPEDRKSEGIIGALSIRENIILALQARMGWWNPLSLAAKNTIADQSISELRIACADAGTPLEALSGGNQQKVILARWLVTQPTILILDEPTRGIDVGAHADIIQLIRKQCAGGMTVIVASSEIDELVAFSDKVLIMRNLCVVTELQRQNISESAIVAAIAASA